MSPLSLFVLTKKELARIKNIITTLDEVELDGLIIKDEETSTIDYRRSDNSTGSVEKHGEPILGDDEKSIFTAAWTPYKRFWLNGLNSICVNKRM